MSRLPRSRHSLAAAFVATVIVVVAAATAAPLLSGGQASTPAHPEYDPQTLVPERTGVDGTIDPDTASERGTVLVDLAHDNRVSKDELEPFASAIREAGWRVEYAESAGEFGTALSRADALVVVDPGSEYPRGDVDRVETFVENGGRLLLAGEPTRTGVESQGGLLLLVPLGTHIESLAEPFGVSFGESHLFNMATNDGNFVNVFGTATGESALVEGVNRTAMYLATSVRAREGTRLVEAAEGTRAERSDTAGEYPLAVRTGNVVAVGDTTFMESGNYKAADNEQFLGNVVTFLTAADRGRTLLDYPAFVGRDPTVRYTSVTLLGPAKSVTSKLAETRPGQPTAVLDEGRADPGETDVLVTTFSYLEDHPGIEAGIDVSDRGVSVSGYESGQSDLYVIHRPESGYEMVIAADTYQRAENAVGTLTDRDALRENAVSNSTVVVRD